MPLYTPRTPAAEAASSLHSEENTAPALVTGVSLHFGPLRTPYSDDTCAGYTAATVPPAQSRPCPVRYLETPNAPSQPQRTPLARTTLSAETAMLPAVPPAREGRSAGEITRAAVVFPFRAVGFAASLPFRAVGVAHRCTCNALGVDPDGRLTRRAERRERRRERRYRRRGGYGDAPDSCGATQ